MMKQQPDNSSDSKAPHILNASSNLLGICFVVLTSLKVLKLSKTTIIDEVTTVAIISFMASCLLSFLSIRSKAAKSKKFENVADIIFITGISLLFVTTLLFTFDIIN